MKSKLKIGATIYHIGENENSPISKVTIVGFDRLAIQVKKGKSVYFINSWEICNDIVTVIK